jgi:hypothetical protein
LILLIIDDPSRTNIWPEINWLLWLTFLKVAIGQNAVFQALAHRITHRAA